MPPTVSHIMKNRLLSFNSRPLVRRLVQVKDSSPTPDPQFWKDTAYHGQQGHLRLSLFGIPLLGLSYSMSLEDVYAKRGNPHMEKGLKDLVAAGAMEPVTAESLVLDSGCNVGAWLRHLAVSYGCRVCGVDISQKAIEFAREITFSGDERSEFHCHTMCLIPVFSNASGIGTSATCFAFPTLESRSEPANRHAEDFTHHGFQLFRKIPKANPEKFVGIYYWRPSY